MVAIHVATHFLFVDRRRVSSLTLFFTSITLINIKPLSVPITPNNNQPTSIVPVSKQYYPLVPRGFSTVSTLPILSFIMANVINLGNALAQVAYHQIVNLGQTRSDHNFVKPNVAPLQNELAYACLFAYFVILSALMVGQFFLLPTTINGPLPTIETLSQPNMFQLAVFTYFYSSASSTQLFQFNHSNYGQRFSSRNAIAQTAYHQNVNIKLTRFDQKLSNRLLHQSKMNWPLHVYSTLCSFVSFGINNFSFYRHYALSDDF